LGSLQTGGYFYIILIDFFKNIFYNINIRKIFNKKYIIIYLSLLITLFGIILIITFKTNSIFLSIGSGFISSGSLSFLIELINIFKFNKKKSNSRTNLLDKVKSFLNIILPTIIIDCGSKNLIDSLNTNEKKNISLVKNNINSKNRYSINGMFQIENCCDLSYYNNYITEKEYFLICNVFAEYYNILAFLNSNDFTIL